MRQNMVAAEAHCYQQSKPCDRPRRVLRQKIGNKEGCNNYELMIMTDVAAHKKIVRSFTKA
jgi:hypothetical protein